MKRIAMAAAAFALLTGTAFAEEPFYGGVEIHGNNTQDAYVKNVTQNADGKYAANEIGAAAVHNNVYIDGNNDQTAHVENVDQYAEGDYAQNCLGAASVGDGPGCTAYHRP